MLEGLRKGLDLKFIFNIVCWLVEKVFVVVMCVIKIFCVYDDGWIRFDYFVVVMGLF